MSARWFAAGAIAAGLAVILGAFGAHGLQGRVAPDLLAAYETGARYHLAHALALLAVGLAAGRRNNSLTTTAGWLFLAGIAVFSGSLYLMTLTGARWLGAITPIGGLAFILGWIALAAGVLRGVR